MKSALNSMCNSEFLQAFCPRTNTSMAALSFPFNIMIEANEIKQDKEGHGI